MLFALVVLAWCLLGRLSHFRQHGLESSCLGVSLLGYGEEKIFLLKWLRAEKTAKRDNE